MIAQGRASVIKHSLIGLMALGGLIGCGQRADFTWTEVYRDVTYAPSAGLRAQVPELMTQPAVATPDEALSLSQVVALGLRHNRDMQNRSNDAYRAQLGVDRTRRNYFDPQLQLGGNYDDDTGGSADATLDADIDWAGLSMRPFASLDYQDATDNYTGDIGLTVSRQLLRPYEGLRQDVSRFRAERDWSVALYNQVKEERSLRLRLTEAFYDIQRSQRRLAIRAARVASDTEFLRVVSERLREGLAAEVEQVNARISLNSANSSLLSEESTLQGAKERLLDLLGMDVTAAIAIIDEDVTAELSPVINLEADQHYISEAHEDVHIQAMRISLLVKDYQLNQADTLPDIVGSITVQESRSGDGPWSGSESEEQSLNMSVDMSLPLDGWRNEHIDVRRQELNLENARRDMIGIRSRLVRGLRRQYRDVQRNIALVQLNQESVEAERARLESTLARYESGDIDNIEVTRAKETMDNAELRLLDAQINSILSLARYRASYPPRAESAAE